MGAAEPEAEASDPEVGDADPEVHISFNSSHPIQVLMNPTLTSCLSSTRGLATARSCASGLSTHAGGPGPSRNGDRCNSIASEIVGVDTAPDAGVVPVSLGSGAISLRTSDYALVGLVDLG